MAILANAPSASFRFLKEQLQLADSDLSKLMSALEAAGYVKSTKDGHRRGASTTFSMTRAGRKAYATHCAALRALMDSVPAPDR